MLAPLRLAMGTTQSRLWPRHSAGSSLDSGQMLVGLQGEIAHSCPGTCLSAPSPSIPPLPNPANPTKKALSEATPAFSSFQEALTKRPRLRGLSLQVPCSWWFWCGKTARGHREVFGARRTCLRAYPDSHPEAHRELGQGDSITWGGGWDDFLWDLLLGLELFLRRSRTPFCGRAWVTRHALTFPTGPHQVAGPTHPTPDFYLGSHSSCLEVKRKQNGWVRLALGPRRVGQRGHK